MRTLLIVDDSRDLTEILARNFSEDYRVITAYDGPMALDVAERERPDVVLLDIGLPGMNGFDVLRELRARDPSVGVVMMTAHGSEDAAVACMKAGAFDYAAKPIDRRALGVKLEHCVERIALEKERLDLSRRLEEKVAELRRANEVLARTNDELKQLDRLKSEFVSTVSHELRTPLTAIKGALGLVVGGVAGPVPEEANAFIEIAMINTERLVTLISDLLDLSRLEANALALQLGPVDLRPAAALAIEAIAPLAEKAGIEVSLQGGDGTVVLADPGRLQQILMNLLSNAVKFSPTASPVAVRIGEPVGDEVTFVVEDHGEGIAPEHHERIFERFTQIDSTDTRRVGGTGLGLAITRSLVERFGGRIWVESAPGAGSRFHVRLCVARGA